MFHLISKVQYFYKSHWLSWLKCFLFVLVHQKQTMPGLCKFNEDWLEKDCYKQWLKRVESDLWKAYCIYCKRNIDIASMDERWKRHQYKISGLPESSVRFYYNKFWHVSTCLFGAYSALYFYRLMYTYWLLYTYWRGKLTKTKLIHVSLKCEAIVYPWLLIKFI